MHLPHHRSGLCFTVGAGLAVLAILAGAGSTGLVAQEAGLSQTSPGSMPLFEQTVEQGILFVDGEFVEPPYAIEAVGNRATVNGRTVFEMPAKASEQPSFPGSRRQRWRSEASDEMDDDYETPRSARRAAERIAEELEARHIVVASSGRPFRNLRLGGDIFTFCEVMLAAERSPQQVNEFIRLSGDETQFDTWRGLLDVSQGKVLRDRLQAYYDRIQAIEAAGVSRAAAIVRMETFAYPLTLAGMLVGVIALGHVLKWTAKSIVAEQREDYAPEVTRCVEIALLLMLVMSAIDLTWTILAGQAGAMREVNPLAAGYIQSPLHLIALKVVATGLGCGILYAWRQRRQVQNATWWMCLVCVLLTFRWVVFDSVIS